MLSIANFYDFTSEWAHVFGAFVPGTFVESKKLFAGVAEAYVKEVSRNNIAVFCSGVVAWQARHGTLLTPSHLPCGCRCTNSFSFCIGGFLTCIS